MRRYGHLFWVENQQTPIPFLEGKSLQRGAGSRDLWYYPVDFPSPSLWRNLCKGGRWERVGIYKGTLQYYYYHNNNNNNRIQRRCSRFLQSPHSATNCTYAQVALAQPCANHVQHIERLSHASVMLPATWYEGTAQLLSLTELKSHLSQLCFIGWTIKPMMEGMKPEYLEKTPGNELQKMPHTTARRFKPQARLEPAG